MAKSDKSLRSAVLPRKTSAQRTRAAALFAALRTRFPDAHCELNWTLPHELLFATILSAQCTDIAVNRATTALFEAFPNIDAFAAATPAEIEPFIRRLGLFRSKARALHESACMLRDRYDGQVPRTMEELIQLRGVARKTANVVLGNCFGVNEGVVVDTHVERLSRRLNLSRATTTTRIERDLMALFPQADWCVLSHLLILHGRRVCKARGGLCASDELCGRFCSNAKAASAATSTVMPAKKKASKRSKIVAHQPRESR